MSQTTVEDQKKGFSGMIADNGPHDVISKSLEAAGPVVGLAVSQGTSDEECKEYVTGKMLGVILHSHDRESGALEAKDMLGIMKSGRVLVTVEDAVVADGDVFIRHAGVGSKGAFRSDADVANADQIAGAKYLSSAGAGELAIVDLNLY